MLTYTANAGFILTHGDTTLIVDAFPLQEARGFSALCPEDFETLLRQDFAGQRLYVIATHDHPDHYSRPGNEAFLAAHPQARFIGAVTAERMPAVKGRETETVELLGERPLFYLPGLTLEFARLVHEGEEFSSVPNYGCLATFAGPPPYRAVFLGDAKPADPAVADWLNGRAVDLALLNFPWICLPRGRRFLAQSVPAKKIAVLHLPYEQTDRNHYLDVTRKAAALYRPEDTVLLTAFGQTYR